MQRSTQNYAALDGASRTNFLIRRRILDYEKIAFSLCRAGRIVYARQR